MTAESIPAVKEGRSELNGDCAQMRTPSGSLLHVTNIPYKEVFSFDDSRKTVLTRKLLSTRINSIYPTLLIDTKFISMSAQTAAIFNKN